ncbi:MAG: hypothetical protein WBY71_03325 [Nitrososphaeraceae archaeon]
MQRSLKRDTSHSLDNKILLILQTLLPRIYTTCSTQSQYDEWILWHKWYYALYYEKASGLQFRDNKIHNHSQNVIMLIPTNHLIVTIVD